MDVSLLFTCVLSKRREKSSLKNHFFAFLQESKKHEFFCQKQTIYSDYTLLFTFYKSYDCFCYTKTAYVAKFYWLSCVSPVIFKIYHFCDRDLFRVKNPIQKIFTIKKRDMTCLAILSPPIIQKSSAARAKFERSKFVQISKFWQQTNF